MKSLKIASNIILLVTLLLFTNSCEKKWPNNGDLDGMWQLMSIEQDGKVTSLKDTKYYWSIRTDLIQYTDYGGADKKFSHFRRTDGMLILTDFCYESLNASSTDNDEWIPFEERDIMYPWGINAEQDPVHTDRITQTFTIDYLSSDCMILSTPTYKLEFRKF